MTDDFCLPFVLKENQKISSLIDRQISLRRIFNERYDLEIAPFLDLTFTLYVVKNVKQGKRYTLNREELERASVFADQFQELQPEQELINYFIKNG